MISMFKVIHVFENFVFENFRNMCIIIYKIDSEKILKSICY